MKRLLLGAMALLSGGNVAALRPPLSEECLISMSDVIVAADVKAVGTKPVATDALGPIHRFDVTVVETLRGSFGHDSLPKGELQILFRPLDREGPKPKLGKRYLLFVSDSPVGPYVINGFQGIEAFEVANGNRRIEALRAAVVRVGSKRPKDCPADAW